MNNFWHQVEAKYASQKSSTCFINSQATNISQEHAGHQLAVALTVFINSIQNTIITLYEVESQKTVNTKPWKWTDWISELFKQIFDYNLCETSTGKRKKRKVMMQCNAQAYQSILQNPIALKAEAYFKNRPEYISNMLSKSLMSSKVEQVWATLEDFSPDRYSVKQKKQIPRKRKVNPFVIKSTLEFFCDRSRDTGLRENSNLKAETQMEKTHSKQWGNLIHQHNEKTK